MSGTKYRFRVLGDEKVRARGELAFVLPQALDLVDRSSYTALVMVNDNPAPGVLRLRRTDEGTIEAHYETNPNHPAAKYHQRPMWLESIQRLSEQLGRNITWQPTP